ncbi:MAG: N-acetylglucosamine-6-phosphate deacetylase [Lactobacillaceae bacterium]|jgi:N-acetylglucosamine-6-phosphate deacetylase|nr:N-acetylglucosamine-6-phosphate deacetylase [Lactobacillaceae bacterium]
MNKVISNIKIYTGKKVIENGYIRFNKTILSVGDQSEYKKEIDDEILKTDADFLVPGFIDVHVHGGYGIDTMDSDVNKINLMLNKMRSEGVTSVFLTTITQNIEEIKKALIVAKKVIEQNPIAVGVHLEGPFINPEMNGAQPKEYVIPADSNLIRELQELSGNNIRLITFAPEMVTDKNFEKTLNDLNIVGSAGHSNDNYKHLEQTQVSHITHLYNRQTQVTSREPGVSGFGLLTDANVEIILDGIHVAPEIIKLTTRAKDISHIEIITDAMRSKGLGDGVSELGGQKVTVKNGQARLDDGHLAGSVLRFIDGFNNIQKFAGYSIEQAVIVSSVNQATEFHLNDVGTIENNKRANFNLMSNNGELIENYLDGENI